MKKTILYLTLLWLTSLSTFAQKDTIFAFLDKDWKVIKNKEKAVYTRKLFKEAEGKWIVLDYFLNGTLQMSGSYQEQELKNQEGHFKWFDADGKLQLESDFKDNKLIGKDIYYRANGKIEHYDRYDSLGRYRESAYFKEDGTPSEMTAPEFEGGKDAMYEFIANNLKYPKEASKLDITGKVFVQFRIDTDGAVSDLEIVKSPHESLTKEAIRLVSMMPKWKPATRDGEPVASPNIYLPINFAIK